MATWFWPGRTPQCGDLLRPHFYHVDAPTPVVLMPWPNVPPINSVRIPWFVLLWLLLMTTLVLGGERWGAVTIELAMDYYACWHAWVSLAQPEHVQGDGGLINGPVPQMHQEFWIGAAHASHEVVLPYLYGPFSRIPLVHLGWHQLVINAVHLVIFFDETWYFIS